MEKGGSSTPNSRQDEEIPSLFTSVQSKVPGFDEVSTPKTENKSPQDPEQANQEAQIVIDQMPPTTNRHGPSLSISMPSSFNNSTFSNKPPLTPTHFFQTDQNKKSPFSNEQPLIPNPSLVPPPRNSRTVKLGPRKKKTQFHSQPMGNVDINKVASNIDITAFNTSLTPDTLARSNRLRDNRYDSFKTLSGLLERQITNFRGKSQEIAEEIVTTTLPSEPSRVPQVGRFFDALEGPELDRLKQSEQLVLPGDKKWPFLLRFPVSSFGMCLGLSSQAILYKTISTSAPTSFLHVPLTINLVLWLISISLLGILSIMYLLKVLFYFEAVRREYHHPIRVNFFFAPWIACLFLVMGLPPSILKTPPPNLWYVLMAPILCLELKIYGQWMSGGQRRLSKVANPSNHLSVVGNFVGALLGASLGLKEGPIFFYAVGMAHYIVLFVTLYQRLPTNETLPVDLHPVFFLFVAAPSVASMAWAKITGEFGHPSRACYFIAMFLYASLVVRLNFFRGFRFSLAWWAYTFPMTGAATATIRYATEVDNLFTQSLCIVLSVISSLTVTGLLLSTMFHAWVLHDLFPNDIAIAITHKPSVKITDVENKADLESGASHDTEATSTSS